MNKKIGIFFLTFSLSLYITGTELIEGDAKAPTGQTFSFNVNKNVFSSTGNFYEGANEVVIDNQFSLSRLVRGTKAFAPLTPETITLQSNPNTPNPLYGAAIIALGVLEKEVSLFVEDMPVVVASNKPATVYLFEDITKLDNIVVESSGDVHDAVGSVSSGIVNLTTDDKYYVFAPAKPNSGEFGDLNSGIALLIRGIVDVAQGETTQTFRVFKEVNVDTGSAAQPHALLLDPTSPTIAITDPLANIVKNQVTMHWDGSLQRLFIGLQTTSNSNGNDGTRAVVMAKFEKNEAEKTSAFILQEIAPDTVFTPGSTTSIIGAIGANQQVSIHNLKTMYTSTALHYLIVVGDVGNPASTQQSVYALPLVNTGNSTGMIANKNAQPQNIFSSSPITRLIARNINEAATTSTEMNQSTDVAVQVGGGQLLAGPINNMIVRDDTVYASVGTSSSGVYSSQALFDTTGKIVAWTQWQRAAGTTDNIFGVALNPFEGNFILASGNSTDTVNTIKRTNWTDGSPESLQPLTKILDATYALNNGGIQGMQTFLPNTPGLQNISLLGAGGIGAITLAQTGTLNANGIIIPTAGPDFNNLMEFTNGTITSNVVAQTVTISGGALSAVGPITALEIGRNASNGWLFVGGSNGLTVLAQEDGSGWNPAMQLSNNLTGLQSGMRFITIGNYSFVKKLIYDSNFLFVITHNTVDRINLTTSNFGTNTLDVTTLATIGSNGVSTRGGFLDGLFSQALGIIATTDGLLRIGNGKDVRTITSESDAQWTDIAIGENAGAPTALYTVTATNRAQDITRNIGGYFYVLTADNSLDQSRINRFTVQTLMPTDTVSATTVQPFDDLFVKNIPSFLLSFGEFRSNFSTDGALYFATRNQNNILSPIVMLTPAFPVPRVGVANVGDRSSIVKINFQQGTEINYFSRSAASGSWIAAGNFNTQVLE